MHPVIVGDEDIEVWSQAQGRRDVDGVEASEPGEREQAGRVSDGLIEFDDEACAEQVVGRLEESGLIFGGHGTEDGADDLCSAEYGGDYEVGRAE